MSATAGILLALGAVVHVAGAVLRVRSSAPVGRIVALLGALVVAGCGIGVLTSSAAVADHRIAAAWALAAAVVMVAGHGFGAERSVRWAALASSLLGLGAAVTAAWLLQVAPRPSIEAAPLVATAWTTAHSTCLAGGLAFLVVGLFAATDDVRLRHAAWPALGLVVAVVGASLMVATGSEGRLISALALSDAHGAAVEIRASVVSATGSAEPVAIPARLTVPALAPLLLATTCLAVIAAAASALRARAGRLCFAAMAMGALGAMVVALGAIGPHTVPSSEALLSQLAAAGVATELLSGSPGLSAPTVAVHPAAALPVAMVCWLMAVLGGVRALAPASGDHPTARGRRHFGAGPSLATSRDAVMLGALLLWLAVALAMFANLTTVERFVADHRLTAHVACAVLAVTAVLGWHAALGRASRTGFVLWLTVLSLAVAIAAVVLISGVLTAHPLQFLAIGA